MWTWGFRVAGATSRPRPPSLPPPGPGAVRPAPPASLWTSPPRGGWRWGGVWPWLRRASPWGGACWPPASRRTRRGMRPAARPVAPWYPHIEKMREGKNMGQRSSNCKFWMAEVGICWTIRPVFGSGSVIICTDLVLPWTSKKKTWFQLFCDFLMTCYLRRLM